MGGIGVNVTPWLSHRLRGTMAVCGFFSQRHEPERPGPKDRGVPAFAGRLIACCGEVRPGIG